MIPKKARGGTKTRGLLAYLYGPGKRDEHTDPHMIAAWDATVEDPAQSPEMTLSDLALLLDAPVHALRGKRPDKHVYHVAVRNPVEDRVLTDAEWAEVAQEMMAASGIAPHGDDFAARWVAVRHAEDHIHIVATMARQDGRQPNVRRDMVHMQAAARKFEQRWGLRTLVSGDRTARKWPRTGEVEKAAQLGRSQTPRESLQRSVREAAAGARNEADFFDRVEAGGLRVKQRVAPDGQVTGYAVALPGDRDAKQRPVWFSGSKLAPDLSLPRVRERWQQSRPSADGSRSDRAERAWQIAADKLRQAEQVLGAGGRAQGAGDVAALGDVLAVAAGRAPQMVREQLLGAAFEFERAGRAPGARAMEGRARELLQEAGQELTQAAYAGSRNPTAAMLGTLLALASVVEAARTFHEAQEHQAQAEASGRAGQLLRDAVKVTRVASEAGAGKTRGKTATKGAVKPQSAGPQRDAAPRPGYGDQHHRRGPSRGR